MSEIFWGKSFVRATNQMGKNLNRKVVNSGCYFSKIIILE